MVGVTAYCVFSGWDIALSGSDHDSGDAGRDPRRSTGFEHAQPLARGDRRPGTRAGRVARPELPDVVRRRRGPHSLRASHWSPDLQGQGVGPLGRAAIWVVTAVIGTLATTLVAQFATAPFATYHFQTVQPFGLVGNALTLPLVSLAVMPAAVLGILPSPCPRSAGLVLMGLAVRGMLTISTWIAGFDRAVYVVPAFGPAPWRPWRSASSRSPCRHRACGGLGSCHGRGGGPGRRPGAAGPLHRPGGRGRRDPLPPMRLATLGKPPPFVLEQWLKADGDGRKAGAVTALPDARCDRLGCTARTTTDACLPSSPTNGRFPRTVPVRHPHHPAGGANDCAAKLVLDRAFLVATGRRRSGFPRRESHS